ncbi:MAG: hypothetical protein Q9170_004793 [Blastenia crenularia]
MSFAFDQSIRLNPRQVYQTGIQLMYELAQRSWTEKIVAMVAESIEGLNVLMLFVNPYPPSGPHHLQTMHCVASLYRAIVMMTDGVLFCQLRSHISIRGTEIGALSITPLDDAEGGISKPSTIELQDDRDALLSNTSLTILSADSGKLEDPSNPHFTLNYHFFGKSIIQKEVSLAILEAMATAAPFSSDVECKEILARTPEGGALIIVESVDNRQVFTYQFATRALKLIYQGIIIRLNRYGDMYVDLKFDGVTFGELRMLRGSRDHTEQ